MKKIFAIAVLALITMTSYAQNFGSEDVVSKATTWTFDQLVDKGYTGLESLNGLYVRATEKHPTRVTSSKLKVDGIDGNVLRCFSYISAPNMMFTPSAAKVPTAGSRVAESNDRCVAFNAGVAGKVHVAFRAKANLSDRLMKIYFKGASDSDYKEVASVKGSDAFAEEHNLAYLDYTATEAGTFIIVGNCTPVIYAIQFAPKDK